MDKYTIILKVDEIRRLAVNKKYEKAIKILETLDINKMRIITDLSVFADVFEHNKQYGKAIEILLRIYEKAKTRRVLFQLAKVYAKNGNFMEAEKYYDEFVEAAPRDSNRYILRYKIDKMEKKPLEELVRDLEAFKEVEYIEEWAYELAKLYHKSGYRDQCIKECREIILWFGEGIIVEKAKLLEAYYMGESEPIEVMNAKEKKQVKIDTKNLFTKDEKIDESISTQENEPCITSEEKSNGEQIKQEESSDTKSVEMLENHTEPVIDISQLREMQTEDMRNFIATEELRINGININEEMKNYMNISSIRKQLTMVFQNIKKEDKYKHIIITGCPCSGKTYLAKLFTRVMYKLGFINTSKVAMISGDKLNRIRLEEKQDKLVGGCVIVEKAGQMNCSTVDKIISMMETYEDNIVVILEDNYVEMKQLVLENRNLAEHIYHSVELPMYSSLELLGFAKNYLTEHKVKFSDELEEELKNMVNWVIEENEKEHLSAMIKVLSDVIDAATQRDGQEVHLKAEDFHMEEK